MTWARSYWTDTVRTGGWKFQLLSRSRKRGINTRGIRPVSDRGSGEVNVGEDLWVEGIDPRTTEPRHDIGRRCSKWQGSCHNTWNIIDAKCPAWIVCHPEVDCTVDIVLQRPIHSSVQGLQFVGTVGRE